MNQVVFFGGIVKAIPQSQRKIYLSCMVLSIAERIDDEQNRLCFLADFGRNPLLGYLFLVDVSDFKEAE